MKKEDCEAVWSSVQSYHIFGGGIVAYFVAR